MNLQFKNFDDKPKNSQSFTNSCGDVNFLSNLPTKQRSMSSTLRCSICVRSLRCSRTCQRTCASSNRPLQVSGKFCNGLLEKSLTDSRMHHNNSALLRGELKGEGGCNHLRILRPESTKNRNRKSPRFSVANPYPEDPAILKILRS